MKSFNGLYQQMMQLDEIIASIEEAAEDKTGRREVAGVLRKKETRAQAIAEKIDSGKWMPREHERSSLQEGSHRKVRKSRNRPLTTSRSCITC